MRLSSNHGATRLCYLAESEADRKILCGIANNMALAKQFAELMLQVRAELEKKDQREVDVETGEVT